jgi:hypothetical protein
MAEALSQLAIITKVFSNASKAHLSLTAMTIANGNARYSPSSRGAPCARMLVARQVCDQSSRVRMMALIRASGSTSALPSSSSSGLNSSMRLG